MKLISVVIISFSYQTKITIKEWKACGTPERKITIRLHRDEGSI